MAKTTRGKYSIQENTSVVSTRLVTKLFGAINSSFIRAIKAQQLAAQVMQIVREISTHLNEVETHRSAA
jgi:hypothetical protein